jgi:hypothetical protein
MAGILSWLWFVTLAGRMPFHILFHHASCFVGFRGFFFVYSDYALAYFEPGLNKSWIFLHHFFLSFVEYFFAICCIQLLLVLIASFDPSRELFALSGPLVILLFSMYYTIALIP